MLLKRFLVLAGGVLLFILGFVVYFEIANAQMEDVFHQERVKFGVEGAVLTEPDSAVSISAPAHPNPARAVLTPPQLPYPNPSAPSPRTSTDTNLLIGPVPPPDSSAPDSSAPDNTPAPSTTPPTPDSTSAPTTPAPSTMDYRRESGSPFIVLAAYHPGDGVQIQTSPVEPPPGASPLTAPAPPPVSPSETTSPAPKTGAASAMATNAAPSSPTSTTGHSTTSEGSVIVLLYHQFKPAGVAIPAMYRWTMNQDVFEAEMKYIHDNGYHVIPMSDLLKFLRHEITVPPGSVVITIDDGYKSAIVYAEPILKKYGYPWTFFIYPEFITTAEGPGAASWNDLLALQAEGVDIESHSMTHPTLTKHSQKIKGAWHSLSADEYDQWLTNETSGSKALLEQKLGKPVTCFAYPFGAYNKEVEAKAIAAGYDAIFTVADNPVHSTTSLHSIGRYTITREVEKNFAAYLRQGALGLEQAEPAPGATISNPRPVISAVIGYAGTLDPKSIETSVRDFGVVRHDFDPGTNTVRLYLPRDLIAPVVLVNIRVKDASTGQVMVSNWHFNYEPAATAAAAVHPAIGTTTNTSPTSPDKSTTPASTNAPVDSPSAPAMSPH